MCNVVANSPTSAEHSAEQSPVQSHMRIHALRRSTEGVLMQY